jgi:hypothetical protein
VLLVKLTVNLCFCILILLIAAVGCRRGGPEQKNLLLARVGDVEIRGNDFRAELDRQDPTLRSRYLQNRRSLLDKMIQDELLHQRAMEMGLADEPGMQKRAARFTEDAAIERFKTRDIFSKVKVTEEEIRTRYDREARRPEKSSLVRPVLYLSSLPAETPQDLLGAIGRGVHEGLSFPEIARRNSLLFESVELDSIAFRDLDQQVRRLATAMENRTGRIISLGETIVLLFKDAEPLYGRIVRDEKGERALRTACYHRIRRALREQKQKRELREWLRSRRAASTIRVDHEALDDMTRTDSVVAEVNGVSLTVQDVTAPLEGLSPEQRRERLADKKSLVDEAINREILRQEAFRRNLHESDIVKKEAARKVRRLLINVVIEKDVVGVTGPARDASLRDLVAKLREDAGVEIVAANLKKMYIPASKSIEEIFGGETI